MIARLKSKAQDCQRFLMHDLWLLQLNQVPLMKRTGLGMLRVLHIVIRDFVRDNCALQAASLTYITLMSMVPILAVAFSVAKGLNAQKMLMDAMQATIDKWPPQVAGFILEVFKLVDQTDFATLGAIGILLLFYTVIKVMGQIESTFNDIWGIKTSRTLMRKFADYTSVLVVVPVLVIVAFTLNATLESKKMTDWLEKVVAIQVIEDEPVSLPGQEEATVAPGDSATAPATDPLPAVDGSSPAPANDTATPAPPRQLQVQLVVALYRIGMRLMGVLGIVVGFTFLYVFLPNTRVYWRSALIGGIFAGLAWLGWQWACINVQIIVTKWNKIYGAFATLPISLFWLNVNWMIALLGAEICFAVQNYQTYTMEAESDRMSHASRRSLAYLLVYDICRAFRDGEAWKAEDYQEAYNIPIRLIKEVLFDMEEERVILKTAEGGFVPGRDMTMLTLDDVEKALGGAPDERTARLSRRLGLKVLSLLGNDDDAYHQALGKRTFAGLLEDHEKTSPEPPT